MAEHTMQFDLMPAFGFAPGFRLRRLEVYNWGTFDEKVQSFTPEGGTALLTGESGSGKSTLVDALLTLVMPPRKISYNKAADASAKERSVTSYVRGYYGQKRGLEGAGQAEALRGFDAYSVILAVFADPGLERTITLAKVFRFRDETKPPVPLYVIAQKELSIVADFALDAGGVQSLKKRLSQTDQIDVFDEYIRYGERFRRLLGIEDENTLNLFQQTVAMKKVEALTEFVRANMLEDPDVQPEIDKLIERFQDLSNAHAAVIKARDQIGLLEPLVKEGGRRLEKIKEREQLQAARNSVPTWFSAKRLHLIEHELEQLLKSLQRVRAQIEQTERLLHKKSEDEERVRAEIYANGGGALERLKMEIDAAEKTWAETEKKRAEFTRLITGLKLQTPATSEDFEDIRARFALMKTQLEDVRKECEERSNAAAVVLNTKSIELETLQNELESLRQRSSSIPHTQIELRNRLCADLGLDEGEFPFVGELLEVKNSESAWEGAIERILHSFGLSLLVLDAHYKRVMEWVDTTNLGKRLVYYRVNLDRIVQAEQASGSATVSDKLIIKPDSPFFLWLQQELRQRFPHSCTEDAAAFRRESYAVSVQGQVKTKGGRHEKDDRQDISDRSRYILGFSNERKIEVLAQQEQAQMELIATIHAETQRIRATAENSREQLFLIQSLEMIQRFDEIDEHGAQTAVDALRKRYALLEGNNDVLAALGRELETLRLEKSGIQEKLEEQNRERYQFEARQNDLEKQRAENQSIEEIVEAAELLLGTHYLDAHNQEMLAQQEHTLDNTYRLQESCYSWLEKKNSQCSSSIESHNSSIVRRMADFNNRYPEDTREIDTDIESLSDYTQLLGQLQRDDLPRFEKRFKDKLNEGTINQIALFQAQLESARLTIRNRIEQINRSLFSIDYNEGRYIRLEYDETRDSQIQDFRSDLRLCTEGALGGDTSEQYAETKFLQVKTLVDRFKGRAGETDADARWTSRVTDVRNWFTFAASERWRETDEEYEHYTDSGGKSGGQKEKLAYMVLGASLVYHYGLSDEDARGHSFRLVIIDEAFLKSSDESAKFGLELFKRLDLQLLIVTPLLKIHTIEPYITHVGFISHDDLTHKSGLRNLSIEEYQDERTSREVGSRVAMD